jgi:hypothetical protein
MREGPPICTQVIHRRGVTASWMSSVAVALWVTRASHSEAATAQHRGDIPAGGQLFHLSCKAAGFRRFRPFR